MRSLTIETENQIASNWCWCATATSIANFYEGEGVWSQCKLAMKVFATNDCCKATEVIGLGGRVITWDITVNGDYNKTQPANVGLAETGHHESTGPNNQKISFDLVRQEINAGRPILIALAYSGWFINGGHGVIITGYNDTDPKNPTIEVRDPAPGVRNSVCDFNDFPESYSLFHNTSFANYLLTKK
jgi:hypothetical protein